MTETQQRHFLVFYHSPTSRGTAGSSVFDESAYRFYRLKAPSIPPLAVIQKEIAQTQVGNTDWGVYHIRVTGITEVTSDEYDDFVKVNAADAMQQATQHPPQYPGDCVIL